MSVLSAGQPAGEQAGRRLATVTRQRRLSQTKREWLAAYLFLLPDLLGLLIFIGLPMILSLSLGFFTVSGFGQYTFTGLANYQKMLTDPTDCPVPRHAVPAQCHQSRGHRIDLEILACGPDRGRQHALQQDRIRRE